MRVVSGIRRGKILKAPEGMDTRPTTDKVKAAIFNIIQFEIQDKKILDLFGGSGQLAIEAVSRGAKEALVVDNSRKAVEIIKENIKNCGFENEIGVRCADFSEVLTKAIKYDVIFLDPPYSSDLLKKALELIVRFDILSNNGIIVCETDDLSKVDELFGEKYSVREYKYGRVRLLVIRN